MVKLSDAQKIAIHDHDHNMIVVAGAGSGKTFVLVERFLSLLDAHPDWPLNALVAITFTKKAAQEMRDRVRRALEDRYNTANSPEIRDVWSKRIAAMDSARIDTIHGLCASILRANAAEAAIDPGFEVLDDVDAQLLLDDVIERFLQDAAQQDDPEAELLIEYEVNAVRHALESLIAITLEALPDDLFARWQAAWEHNAGQVIANLRTDEMYRLCADWIPEGGWPEDTDDKLMNVWSSCWSLLETIDQSDSVPTCIDAMQRLTANIKVNAGAAGNWGGKEQLTLAKERLKTIREMVNAALDSMGQQPGALDERAAELLPLWVSLIQQTQTMYRQQKQADSLLDFDDLERLTNQLLTNHPAVQARYRANEFKHVMVDEFQDTNPVQWAIVRAIADIAQQGSLFVVGDPKQSIYMFRKADVSVFESVKAQIIESDGIEVALSTSYRTHDPLVTGFNGIFERVLRRDQSSPVRQYEVEFGAQMQASRKKAPSDAHPIEMILIDKSLMGDESDSDSRRRWEAYELARRLQHIVDHEQRPIFDKQRSEVRPIGYGDIALLFQSLSNITLYEDVFKLCGLPFVTVSGRGYYNRQEVWDVLALLTALHNPQDNLSLATALRSPMFGLSDDALLALRLLRNETSERLPLWDALAQPEVVPEGERALVVFARTCLNRLHRLAGRVTIAELLRAALDETGYLAVLTGLPDGARRRGNVEKLLDKAETSGQVTLGAFNQYLQDLSAREVREGEATVDVKDAVTLMTVHASKGLEFPLVGLVDIGWSRVSRNSAAVAAGGEHGITCKVYDPTTDKLETSYAYEQEARLLELREKAERKRLLYVAATRAQDYLICSGQMPASRGDSWKETTWLGWLWQALDFDNREFMPGSHLFDTAIAGTLRVSIPEHVPDDGDFELQSVDTGTGWDDETVRKGQPLPASHAPLLLDDLHITRSSFARHITATQIADLGSALIERDSNARHKFRRSILQDAPGHIEQVSMRQPITVSQRIIGDIVHKVLGWWRFPDGKQEYDRILDSYAWQLGVVDERQRKYAVQEAHKLIEMMLKSEVYDWLVNTDVFYRELPFVYRTEKRVIHGVLDVLFQDKDDLNRWVVVDYKTSHVKGYRDETDRQLVEAHAHRYYLQVGVYAAAVQQQLKMPFGDLVPDVYIYYIRYGQHVKIATDAWQTALSELENSIGNMLVDETG
ncbi:MAG: UvrD-helicase domain-containing protein [Anaerolineae bacterium]